MDDDQPVPPLDVMESAVRAALVPAFEAFGFTLTHVQLGDDPGLGAEYTILFEADPLETDARFPQLGLAASYGEQWPAGCIDLWVSFMHRDPRIFVQPEQFGDLVLGARDAEHWHDPSWLTDPRAARALAWRTDPLDACRALADLVTDSFRVRLAER